MNDSLKDWIIQVRYPYTAGIIAVIWAGSAAFVFVRPEVSVEVITVLVAIATLIIALIGFSSSRR